MLLAEISKGSEVMDFADYIQNSKWIPKKHRVGFEKLGGELFKMGFKFIELPNPRFVKDDPEGELEAAGWAIVFPHSSQFNAGVEVVYSNWNKGTQKMEVGRANLLVDEIQQHGLDTCLQTIKKQASWNPA